MPKLSPEALQPVEAQGTPNPHYEASRDRYLRQQAQQAPQHLSDAEMGIIGYDGFWNRAANRTAWEFSNENTFTAPMFNAVRQSEFTNIFGKEALDKKGGALEFLASGNNRTYVETLSGQDPNILLQSLDDGATARDLLNLAQSHRTLRQRQRDRQDTPEGWKTIMDFVTIGIPAIIDPVNAVPIAWAGKAVGIRNAYYAARASRSTAFHRWGTPLYGSMDWMVGGMVGAAAAEVPLAFTAGDRYHRDPVANTVVGGLFAGVIGGAAGGIQGLRRPQAIPESAVAARQKRYERMQQLRQQAIEKRRIARGEGPEILAERAVEEAEAAIRNSGPASSPVTPKRNEVDEAVTQVNLAADSLAKTRKKTVKAPVGPTSAAVKMADELGVDINGINGTGAKGRVTVGDVKNHAKSRATSEIRTKDDAGEPLKSGDEVIIVDESGVKNYQIRDGEGLALPEDVVVFKNPEPLPVPERAKTAVEWALRDAKQKRVELEQRLEKMGESDEFSYGISKEAQDRIDFAIAKAKDQLEKNKAIVAAAEARGKGLGKGKNKWTAEETSAKKAVEKLTTRLKNLEAEGKQRWFRKEAEAEMDGLAREIERLQDILEAVETAADPADLVKLINNYEPEHMMAVSQAFDLLNFQMKTDEEFAEAVLEVLKDMHEGSLKKKAEIAAKIQDIEHSLKGLKEKDPDYKKLLRQYHALQQSPLFDFTMLQGYREAQQAAADARLRSAQDNFIELEGEHAATETGTLEARQAFESFQKLIEGTVSDGGRDQTWTRQDYRAWKAMKREVARMVGERRAAFQKALDEALEDIPGFEDVKGNMHAQMAIIEDIQMLSKDLGKREIEVRGKLKDHEELLAKLEDDTKKLEDMRDAEVKAEGEDGGTTTTKLDVEEKILALDARVAGITDEVIRLRDELEKIQEARTATDERKARADAFKAAKKDGVIALPTNKTLVELQKLQLEMMEWEEGLIKGWAKSTMGGEGGVPQRSNFVEMMMDEDARTWYLKMSQEDWRATQKAQAEELARRREQTHLMERPDEVLPDDIKGEIEIDDTLLQAFDALLVAKQTGNHELYGVLHDHIQDYFKEKHLTPEDMAMADLKVEHQEVLTWFYADKVGDDLVQKLMESGEGKYLSSLDFRAKFGEEIYDRQWWEALYESGKYLETEVVLLQEITSPEIRAHLVRFFDMVNEEYRTLLSERLHVLIVDSNEYIRVLQTHSSGTFWALTDPKGFLQPLTAAYADGVLLNLATSIRRSNGTYDLLGDPNILSAMPEGGFVTIRDQVVVSPRNIRQTIRTRNGLKDFDPAPLWDKLRSDEANNLVVMLHEINHFLYKWTVPERDKAKGIENMRQEWVTWMRRLRKLEEQGKGELLNELLSDAKFYGSRGRDNKRWRREYLGMPLWVTKLGYYANTAAPRAVQDHIDIFGDIPSIENASEYFKWFDELFRHASPEESERIMRVVMEEYVVDSTAHTFLTGGEYWGQGIEPGKSLASVNFGLLNRLRWFGHAKGNTWLAKATREHMVRVHRGRTKFDVNGRRNGLELAKAELAHRDIRRRLARKFLMDEVDRIAAEQNRPITKPLLFRRFVALYDNNADLMVDFRPFILALKDLNFYRPEVLNDIIIDFNRFIQGNKRSSIVSMKKWAEDVDTILKFEYEEMIRAGGRQDGRDFFDLNYLQDRTQRSIQNFKRWAWRLNENFEEFAAESPERGLYAVRRALDQAITYNPNGGYGPYRPIHYSEYRTSGSLTDLVQERLLNRKAIEDVLEATSAELAERHSKPNGFKTPIATVADFIRLKAIAEREISGSVVDTAPDDFAAEIANALFDDTAVVFGDATPRGGVRAEHIRWSFIAKGIETQKLVNEAWIRYRRVQGLEPTVGGKLLEKATGTIRANDEVYTAWFNDILNHLERGTNATDVNVNDAVTAMRKFYDESYAQFQLSGIVPGKKTRPRNEATGNVQYAPHLWDTREVRARKDDFITMVMEEIRGKVKADEFDPLEVRQQAEEIWRNITETGITYSSKAMSGLHIHIGKRTGDRHIHLDEPWKFREAGFFEKDPQKYVHRFAATWGGKHATNVALAQRFGIDLEEGIERLLAGREDVVFTIEAGENFRRMIKNARKKKPKNRDPIEHQLVEAVKAKAPDNPIRDQWYRVAGNRDLRSEMLYHMHKNFEINLAATKDKKKQRTLGIEQKRYAERMADMMNRLEGAIVDDAGDPVVGSVVDTINSGMIAARLGKLPMAMLQEMASHTFMKLVPGDVLSRHIFEMGTWWKSMTPAQQNTMMQIVKRVDPWRLRGVGEEIGNIGDQARRGLDPSKAGQRLAGAAQDLGRDAAQLTFNLSGAAKVEQLQRLLAAKVMHNEMVILLPQIRKAAIMAGEGRMTPEILRDAGIQDPRAWYEYNKLGWTTEKIEILSKYRTVDPDGWVFFNVDQLRRDAYELSLKSEGKRSEEAIHWREQARKLYEVADTYHGSMRNRVDAMIVNRNINSTPTYAHNSKAFGALFTSLRGFSLNYQNKFNRVAHQRGEVQLGSYFAQAMVWGMINLVGIKVANGDMTESYMEDLLSGRATMDFMMESALRTGISAGWFGDLLTTLYYNGNADSFMTPAAVGWGQDIFNQVYKTGYGIMDFVGLVDHDETSAGYWPIANDAAAKKNTEGFLNALPVYNLWFIDAIVNNAIMQPNE